MRILVALALVLTGCSATRQRITCVGFDISSTAWRSGNPYDAGWLQVLKATRSGDHTYAMLINEKGLSNGAPLLDFTFRPYSFWRDKRRDYEQAVNAKIESERQALAAALKRQVPSQRTEIIGFYHAASQLFHSYPVAAQKELLVITDAIQEGDAVDLARLALTDAEIGNIIAAETRAGRLPDLAGVAVWVVTGPSLQTTQMTSNHLLRIEVFWRRYLKAAKADLRGYSPVLVNFGRDE